MIWIVAGVHLYVCASSHSTLFVLLPATPALSLFCLYAIFVLSLHLKYLIAFSFESRF